MPADPNVIPTSVSTAWNAIPVESAVVMSTPCAWSAIAIAPLFRPMLPGVIAKSPARSIAGTTRSAVSTGDGNADRGRDRCRRRDPRDGCRGDPHGHAAEQRREQEQDDRNRLHRREQENTDAGESRDGDPGERLAAVRHLWSPGEAFAKSARRTASPACAGANELTSEPTP